MCTSGVRRLYLGYAYIHTTPYPGIVNWQIEARRNNAVSVIRSGSVDMGLYGGSYEIKNTFDMYTQVSSSDVAIRLHVTSPSDMSSAWFTAEPMSAGSPCSQY
ncbi:MAG: hypothetical protein EOO38_19200 [Cytophagaceae bacterium]|nr:MAG: hypothetical protein EOO38_19200 [Cytophagaceae bacterium]